MEGVGGNILCSLGSVTLGHSTQAKMIGIILCLGEGPGICRCWNWLKKMWLYSDYNSSILTMSDPAVSEPFG